MYIDPTEAEGYAQAAQMPGAAELPVKFYWRAVKDEAASAKAGRPIYVDKEYVRIHIPKDKFNVPDKPVDDRIRLAYPVQYRHFRATQQSTGLNGMPLAEWPQVTRSQVEELRHGGILTVEQLAAIPEAKVQDDPPMAALRQRAADYLAAAKGAAPVEQMRTQLEEKDSELAVLRRQLKEQQEQNTRLEKKARAAQ